jgi:hypothetical protein
VLRQELSPFGFALLKILLTSPNFQCSPRVTSSMRSALSDLKLQRLDVLHAGEKTFLLGEDIRAVAVTRLLDDLTPLR